MVRSSGPTSCSSTSPCPVERIEVAERVRDAPGTRVLILSMSPTRNTAACAACRGGRYLLKDSTVVELATALAPLRWRQLSEPCVSGTSSPRTAPRRPGGAPAEPALTPRQRKSCSSRGGTRQEGDRRPPVPERQDGGDAWASSGALGIHDVAGLVRYAISRNRQRRRVYLRRDSGSSPPKSGIPRSRWALRRPILDSCRRPP